MRGTLSSASSSRSSPSTAGRLRRTCPTWASKPLLLLLLEKAQRRRRARRANRQTRCDQLRRHQMNRVRPRGKRKFEHFCLALPGKLCTAIELQDFLISVGVVYSQTLPLGSSKIMLNALWSAECRHPDSELSQKVIFVEFPRQAHQVQQKMMLSFWV